MNLSSADWREETFVSDLVCLEVTSRGVVSALRTQSSSAVSEVISSPLFTNWSRYAKSNSSRAFSS